MCIRDSVVPGLFALQVRAIAEAAVERIKAGGDPQVEIMVPLVGSVMELHLVADETDGIVHEIADREGIALRIPVGTMIELPRAALTAHRIAEVAEFFSFGTNDLTQTTLGLSRDDAAPRSWTSTPSVAPPWPAAGGSVRAT